jgi:hypothetical protein
MLDLARRRRPFVAALFLLFASGSARAQPGTPLPPLPPLPAPTLPASPPAPEVAPAPAPELEGAPPEATGAASSPSAPSPGATSETAPAESEPVDAPEPPADNGCLGGTRIRCHDRFYMRIALGVGVTTLAGSGPVGAASVTGISLPARLALGGTVRHGIVLGGTIYGASTPFGASVSGIPSVKGQFEGAGFVVDWFPRAGGGWHFGGDSGVGLAAITASGRDSGLDLLFSAFAGYDGWIGDQWSVGAMLVGTAGTTAKLTDRSFVDTGYRFAPASIGVLGSVLFH